MLSSAEVASAESADCRYGRVVEKARREEETKAVPLRVFAVAVAGNSRAPSRHAQKMQRLCAEEAYHHHIYISM